MFVRNAGVREAVSLLIVLPPTPRRSPPLGSKITRPGRPFRGALPEIFLFLSAAADNGRFIKQIMDLISAPCVSNPSSVSGRRRDCLADFKPSPPRSSVSCALLAAVQGSFISAALFSGCGFGMMFLHAETKAALTPVIN